MFAIFSITARWTSYGHRMTHLRCWLPGATNPWQEKYLHQPCEAVITCTYCESFSLLLLKAYKHLKSSSEKSNACCRKHSAVKRQMTLLYDCLQSQSLIGRNCRQQIGVAPISQLRRCVIKIVTIKGGHLMW